MIWSALWALFWITVGWFILPVINVLAFVASIAAMLAFDRIAPRNQLPSPPPQGWASEPLAPNHLGAGLADLGDADSRRDEEPPKPTS